MNVHSRRLSFKWKMQDESRLKDEAAAASTCLGFWVLGLGLGYSAPEVCGLGFSHGVLRFGCRG